VAVLRILGRLLTIVIGFVLFVLGAVALTKAYWPDVEAVRVAGRLTLWGGSAVLEPLGFFDDPKAAMNAALSGIALRFGALPAGLVLLVAALLPGSAPLPESEPGEAGARPTDITSGSAFRKARKEAAKLAKRGSPFDAAEFCFASGLLDEAAKYYIEAEEWCRAAEVRHAQERGLESAELYLQAGSFDLAGRIFAELDEHARAAEAYEKKGNHGLAAELYEKAGEHLKAASCYEESGFPRHAAQEYTKCGLWEKAALCLEQTILEETSGQIADCGQNAQVQKLVRMAGNLFERADLNEKAEAVYVRGECFAAAAEIALRAGREENAIEYFLKAKDAPRAAEVMERLGQAEEAARILADHHRDLGDDEESARCFERAGELLAAGDIYRMLEQYAQAADCYERFGDSAQAAEMYGLTEDRANAARCYEQAGLYAEAAEYVSEGGDELKQAELLAQAGSFVRAGEIHLTGGRPDEAINVLQQVASEHPEFTTASAMLGEIFRERSARRQRAPRSVPRTFGPSTAWLRL